MNDPEYKPQWICNECGSSDVQTMQDAWFDPNNDYCLIDIVWAGNDYDWCNDCEEETTLDEVEPPDDPWGNSYGNPMYWIPPMDDEYWQEKGDHNTWTVDDEKKYWHNRLGETKDEKV